MGDQEVWKYSQWFQPCQQAVQATYLISHHELQARKNGKGRADVVPIKSEHFGKWFRFSQDFSDERRDKIRQTAQFYYMAICKGSFDEAFALTLAASPFLQHVASLSQSIISRNISDALLNAVKVCGEWAGAQSLWHTPVFCRFVRS